MVLPFSRINIRLVARSSVPVDSQGSPWLGFGELNWTVLKSIAAFAVVIGSSLFPSSGIPVLSHRGQLVPIPGVVWTLEAAANDSCPVDSLGCRLNGVTPIFTVDLVHCIHQPA
jgi:hypothetical protein